MLPIAAQAAQSLVIDGPRFSGELELPIHFHMVNERRDETGGEQRRQHKKQVDSREPANGQRDQGGSEERDIRVPIEIALALPAITLDGKTVPARRIRLSGGVLDV